MAYKISRERRQRRLGSEEQSPRRGRSSKVSRDLIREAALREFAKNGYEGATTAAVARRVGVTQPLIHYHFTDKKSLWRAAVDLAFSRMNSVLQGVEDDIRRASTRDAFAILTRRLVYFNARHPEVGRLILSEAGTPGPRLKWMTEKHIEPLFRSIEVVVKLGKENGTIKDLPVENIIFAFLGAIPHFFDSAPLIENLYNFDPLSSDRIDSHANTLVEMFGFGLLTERAKTHDKSE